MYIQSSIRKKRKQTSFWIYFLLSVFFHSKLEAFSLIYSLMYGYLQALVEL